MKLFLILGIWCLAVSASMDDEVERNYDWSLTPVDFYLYTRRNPTNGRRVVATHDSIKASKYNSAHATRFIIHGYYCSYLTPIIRKIRKALLQCDQYNIIVVDWAMARDRLYSNSALAVPTVGKKVARFINHLVQNHSMLLETTHVIGYGLGAHVAGYTGKNLKSGKINTIIGLDPTSSSFSYSEPSKRLNSTDAFYVETIQTSDILGYKKPIGKATFYPNGGNYQPGCTHVLCNHKRSAVYYLESIIRNSFASVRCGKYDDAIAKNCSLIHSSIRMGGDKNIFMVSGIFYVPINDRAPFGALN